jgi:hypothetical protein
MWVKISPGQEEWLRHQKEVAKPPQRRRRGGGSISIKICFDAEPPPRSLIFGRCAAFS